MKDISEKITDKELKEELQRRISFVTQMIEIGKMRVEQPYTKEHWTGYLAALDGQVGELQFLKGLYDRIR
jgi:hypothetical protein